MAVRPPKSLQTAPLETRSDLKPNAVHDISGALNIMLADMFALYLKTKNFHWHMSGPHFRDYHLLLDEHADQIFATTDDIAERVRKIGGTTLHSIGHIDRLQRVLDNDADFFTPMNMLAELHADNRQARHLGFHAGVASITEKKLPAIGVTSCRANPAPLSTAENSASVRSLPPSVTIISRSMNRCGCPNDLPGCTTISITSSRPVLDMALRQLRRI
jgi:starvation-inducible DNA-binding protein